MDAQGKTVTESPACPGVHGEAIAKNGAFSIGCTDGALIYKDGKFTKITNPRGPVLALG